MSDFPRNKLLSMGNRESIAHVSGDRNAKHFLCLASLPSRLPRSPFVSLRSVEARRHTSTPLSNTVSSRHKRPDGSCRPQETLLPRARARDAKEADQNYHNPTATRGRREETVPVSGQGERSRGVTGSSLIVRRSNASLASSLREEEDGRRGRE